NWGWLGFCSIMEKDKALGGRLFFGCPCVLLSEDRISSGVHTMYDRGSCIVPGSTVVPGGIEARVSRTIPDGSDSKFFNDAMSDVSCYSGAVHGEARRYGPYAKLHPILLEGSRLGDVLGHLWARPGIKGDDNDAKLLGGVMESVGAIKCLGNTEEEGEVLGGAHITSRVDVERLGTSGAHDVDEGGDICSGGRLGNTLGASNVTGLATFGRCLGISGRRLSWSSTSRRRHGLAWNGIGDTRNGADAGAGADVDAGI
ncbi:unnamed protein product, partial [Ilex paraguariensis]